VGFQDQPRTKPRTIANHIGPTHSIAFTAAAPNPAGGGSIYTERFKSVLTSIYPHLGAAVDASTMQNSTELNLSVTNDENDDNNTCGEESVADEGDNNTRAEESAAASDDDENNICGEKSVADEGDNNTRAEESAAAADDDENNTCGEESVADDDDENNIVSKNLLHTLTRIFFLKSEQRCIDKSANQGLGFTDSRLAAALPTQFCSYGFLLLSSLGKTKLSTYPPGGCRRTRRGYLLGWEERKTDLAAMDT
jgi:hypothetical protein